MKTIPITMITGFLGAGKSTLINRILKEKPNTKFGLIVNEFGDVNLESQVLEAKGEDVVELSNGCMCCVVRKDIVTAVETLLDPKKSAKPVDYIIVEASGLSDPIPIAQTFLMNDLDGKVRLDAVLCIVDVENFEKNMEQFKIAYTQLQAADIVLLSKTDIATKDRLEKINEFLKTSVSNVAIVPLDNKFHAEMILDTSAFDHSELSELEVYDDEKEQVEKHAHKDHAHAHHDHGETCACGHNHDEHKHGDHCHHEHSHGDEKDDEDDHECCGHCHHSDDGESRKIGESCGCGHHHDHDEHEHHSHEPHTHEHHHHEHEHVDTVFFKTDKPFVYEKFATFIKSVPESVIRAKGFLWFGTSAEQDLKYLLQFVGARRQIAFKPWADDEKKQSAIVLIGKNLPKKKLLEGLSSCVLEAAK